MIFSEESYPLYLKSPHDGQIATALYFLSAIYFSLYSIINLKKSDLTPIQDLVYSEVADDLGFVFIPEP